jgi:hypothetical protein
MFGKDEKSLATNSQEKSKEAFIDPDAPKPVRGEELDKALNPGKGTYMVHNKALDSGKIVRFLTFYAANKDLVWQCVTCVAFFALGYLACSLKLGLTSDQVKLGINLVLEILGAILGALAAVILTINAPKGAIASSFHRSVETFQMRLQARKAKIGQGEVNEWGVSIRPKK